MDELSTLVERSRGGDLEAYGEIVRRFQDMACGYAYALLGDFHLAQDAAQEAFVQGYRSLGALRDAAAFPGWFRRVVLTHCDRIRRRRRPARSLDGAVPEPTSPQPGPVESAERNELSDQVLAAVRSLPEHQRTVTTLFYINGYTVEDIAGFLETLAGTVKRRLHDSRKQLKERMIAMVAEEFKKSKPDADFRSLVEKAIAKQRERQFADALRLHSEALALPELQEVRADLVADSYYLLSPSYQGAGRQLELAEGIVAGMPSCAPAGEERRLMQRYWEAARGFMDANEVDQAVQCAETILCVAETVRGCTDYRFWRNEGLWTLRGAAEARGDHEAVGVLMEQIRSNMAALEEDLRAACPGLRSEADTEDLGLRNWFVRAGDTLHEYAHHLVYWAHVDKAEGLAIMRRAAEFRGNAATESAIVAWTLSVEGDRDASLERLRKAMAKYGEPELFQHSFKTTDDFDPVRNDPGFLAVLGLGGTRASTPAPGKWHG